MKTKQKRYNIQGLHKDANINIRVAPKYRDAWKHQAEMEEVALTALITKTMNDYVEQFKVD